MDNNARADMPMNWHKFLIYFSLWIAAVIRALDGLQLLTGTFYGPNNEAEQVYGIFSNLKNVDMIFGVIMLAVAAFLIYTRFQLARFREGAPNKLTLVYVLQLAVPLGYAFAVAGIVKMSISEIMNPQDLSSIAVHVVMIFVNRVYYNKRAHLFGDAAAAAGTSSPTYPSATYASSVAPSGGFCPKCGAQVDADDMFCANCGAKLR